LFAGTAMAQTTMSSPVQQPSSIQQMAFQSDDSAGYAVADQTPAAPGVATTPAVPTPPAVTTPASPSNQPPAPPAAKTEEKPAAEKPKEEEKKEEEKPAEEGPYKLFHGPWLDCEHLDIRGYFEAGYTANPTYPLSGFNGPDGYNDLSNQIVLDQLYLIAERVAKVENDCGVDYGYRADVMFGTDAHFVQTTPKGTEWDSTWSGGSPYYGLAMPQLYATLQYNKLTLQGGHFYAPCGYENAMPTENFFYSHTYGFLYGMPTTVTGGLATYKVKDKLLINAGFDTGWNEFEAINGKLNAMFGVNWTSADKDGTINVTSECFIGNTQPNATESTRYEFCTDVNVKLGSKWHYIFENTFGRDSDQNGTGPAAWTGFTNYLLYDINDCWGFGLRYEYFEDLDGALVPGVGLGGIATVYPSATPVLGSKYNDVTIGLNWKPNKNVTCRTEVRWDWASNAAVAGAKPYDDGNSNSQFLWGNDIVVRF
jgi:hypothetical protein